ncbi:MAG: mannose-1-phosphate guanylyltransferase/mannose-6-phosphate isomerase [Sphingobium sp.]
MSSSASIIPVILSGGSGTRLWPLSRPEMPKQLLALTADQTMLQLTVARSHGLDNFHTPIIVAGDQHADIIASQLMQIGVTEALFVLEPMARNTAPAIALAALAAQADGRGDAPLLVMPSDHVIADVGAFHAAIETALPHVNLGWMITFGITPDAPETGYGYIRFGDMIAQGVMTVAQFVEKPDADRAVAMLAEGGHGWNAGIFLFRANDYLAALEAFQPEMLAAATTAMAKARRAGNQISPDAEAFARSASNSIDYAVMEKASKVACVPVNMGWSDVGSWDSLYSIADRDSAGNAVRGNVMALGATNCLIQSEGVRLTLVDVEDLIVVAQGNEVLIMKRGNSQSVRRVVETLKP